MSTNNMPKILLAKSKRGDLEISVQRHLMETGQSAQQIFRLDRRWGLNWCRFFKIYAPAKQEIFLLNLIVAALFHDIGKANEDFYEAVSGQNRITQTLRHEHISALLLHLPEIRRWLSANPNLDLDVICGAVLSHHIKASYGGDWEWGKTRNKKVLRLYLQHPEVIAILEHIAKVANLPSPPVLPSSPWAEKPPWTTAWQQGRNSSVRFGREIRNNLDRCALLLAVKAGVMVSDAASSGLVREGHLIDKWIDDVVHTVEVTDQDIKNAILDPRAEQISKTNGKPFEFQSFQTKASELGNRALLLAACGAGKTLAAWKWAEAQAKAYKIGKVIFLYPTKGTATEGFRDYVGWAPEAEATLLHGASRYELDSMMKNPDESATTAIKNKDFRLSEAEERLFALGLWSRRYFSATVDQFLSFMEHSYSSLCLLPVLADSAVIIDEIHSFDRRMFDNLTKFLDRFDVPVLCMTATLPPTRQKQLIEKGLRVYPNEIEREEFKDLSKKEKHPRYQHQTLSDQAIALSKAITAYKEGKRVLWVVNTVARCQNIASALEKELSQEVLIYHSRYRLKDRQACHTSTVNAFQQREKPVIAVTTQVCEMSLDLDADVLISEVAPASSLIQRFGRANRHLARGLDFRAQLYTYLPEHHAPYIKEEIQSGLEFIKSLGLGEVSQAFMAEMLEKYALSEPFADESARFLDSGYFATPGNLREIDNFAQTSVLDSDLTELQQKLTEKQPYDELIISVPKKYSDKSDSRPSWLPKYLGIAPASQYCPRFGFQVEEKNSD